MTGRPDRRGKAIAVCIVLGTVAAVAAICDFAFNPHHPLPYSVPIIAVVWVLYYRRQRRRGEHRG